MLYYYHVLPLALVCSYSSILHLDHRVWGFDGGQLLPHLGANYGHDLGLRNIFSLGFHDTTPAFLYPFWFLV
jgi:hypothetical protein